MGDIEDYPDYDHNDEDTDINDKTKTIEQTIDSIKTTKETKDDVKALGTEQEIDVDDLGDLDYELPDVEGDGEWNFVRSMEDVMKSMESGELGEDDPEEEGEEIDIVMPTKLNKSEREEL